MPTTAATSTAATATAYSNQRKVDRCQNGVLWAIYDNGSNGPHAFYSTDDGSTWASGGEINPAGAAAGTVGFVNVSFFIDLDDYAHIVWKQQYANSPLTANYHYYMRGTPNAGRTAWTWSAATECAGGGTVFDYPDIVAHREGSDWRAHVVFSSAESGSDYAYYSRINITSAGVISLGVNAFQVSALHGNTAHKYPSIDFNHTGDGKTVAGGTPHLYAAWSAGATGAGKGIRFKKATYSGGTWTWGTEREIDSGQYVAAGYWMNCMFDGTRVVIAGSLDGTVAGALCIYDRDAADTTTTVQYRTTQSDRKFTGSAAYDGNGNVYLFWQTPYSGTARAEYAKWTRGTGLGTPVVFDSSVPDNATRGLYVSAKRGYSNNRIEFIYTDGTSSPYSVTYDSILLPTGGPRMMV